MKKPDATEIRSRSAAHLAAARQHLSRAMATLAVIAARGKGKAS